MLTYILTEVACDDCGVALTVDKLEVLTDAGAYVKRWRPMGDIVCEMVHKQVQGVDEDMLINALAGHGWKYDKESKHITCDACC